VLSIQNQKIEINLNQYGELVEPKLPNLLEIVDNTKEIYINILDTDPMSGGVFVNVLKLINHGDHVKVVERYKSPLGEITIDKHYENAKPSDILKLLFPYTFK